MDLKINITTNNCCNILVEDISDYLSEEHNGTVKGKFKFSETVSIDVLKLNKVLENVIKNSFITKHTDLKEVNKIPIKFDGWFTIEHIVLPSKDWFDKEYNKVEGSALNLYSIVYYSDGESIYKYIDGTSYITPLDEILEVNPINTTISKTNKDYISICFLRKCYVNLCKQIFENRGFSPCWDKNKIDSELIYKRDLIWMAINVIKYLTECNLLYEVERITEIINGCNGLCVSSTNTKNNINNCGCSK